MYHDEFELDESEFKDLDESVVKPTYMIQNALDSNSAATPAPNITMD
jgi:hypothetical protein